MKKLTLIRHAKSSWKHSGLSDYDRPLNKRGRQNAPMMGERLSSRGFAPQRIISSPALRALRTAEAIATAVELPWQYFHVDPRLYSAMANDLLNIIYEFDSNDQWMAIVGHNPETTELANWLSGEYIGNVPTCGVVEMHFKIDRWDQIGKGEESLIFFDFDYPKNKR